MFISFKRDVCSMISGILFFSVDLIRFTLIIVSLFKNSFVAELFTKILSLSVAFFELFTSNSSLFKFCNSIDFSSPEFCLVFGDFNFKFFKN